MLPHYFLCTVLVFISLPDDNIKYSKSTTKNVQLRVKSLKNSNPLLNGNQLIIVKKYNVTPFC